MLLAGSCRNRPIISFWRWFWAFLFNWEILNAGALNILLSKRHRQRIQIKKVDLVGPVNKTWQQIDNQYPEEHLTSSSRCWSGQTDMQLGLFLWVRHSEFREHSQSATFLKHRAHPNILNSSRLRSILARRVPDSCDRLALVPEVLHNYHVILVIKLQHSKLCSWELPHSKRTTTFL